MKSFIYLLPLYLLPFGDLLNIPKSFGWVSLCAFIGIINVINIYPKKITYIVFIQFLILFYSIFFNKEFIDNYPLLRGIFSILWYSMPVIALSKASLIVKKRSFVKFLNFNFYVAFALSLLSIFLSIILPKYIENYRPELTFGEPSWLGLYFYCTLGLYIPFFKTQISENIRFFKIGLFSIFMGGYSTDSAHIVSFIIGTSLFLFINNNIFKKIKILLFRFKLKKSLAINILLLIFLILIFYFLFSINENLLARLESLFSLLEISDLNLTPQKNNNMSVLSWLNSGDKALYVLKNSPIFGFGPGSTGYFQYFSIFYKDLIALFDGVESNWGDGYSLLFRGTIEYGSVFLIIIILNFRKYFINLQSSQLENKSIFLMSFILFIGALLKQTALPQSIVFLAFYLPLIKINEY